MTTISYPDCLKGLTLSLLSMSWISTTRVNDNVSVHTLSDYAVDETPTRPSTTAGPVRIVQGRKKGQSLQKTVPSSFPDRGRWGDSNRIAPGLAPVLRDGSATVVAVHDKPL